MSKKLLLYTTEFPEPGIIGEELLLIYDEVLVKKSVAFKKWVQQFSLKYPVRAGESLKSVDNFSKHISDIVKLCEKTSSRKLTLVVVGGGSVGDFGGFVASILKRGVKLVHVPSTWLAALDSAHGGKTALNVGAAKNQIGTFYPAEKIILVQPLLASQPEARSFEGFGELLKIAFIAGGSLWNQLSKEAEINAKVLWRYLPQAIDAKNKIVGKDPQEKTGYRHVLNLGHSMGHVLESYYELPHGIAVNYGLDFALRWGVEKKIMNANQAQSLREMPVMGYLLSPVRDGLFQTKESVLKEFKRLLLQDKKKTSAQILRFVFLKKPGQFVFREVSVEEVLIEVCRQKEEELYD